MITSVDDSLPVGANGFVGTFGDYLSLAGMNNTGVDAAAASLLMEYQINGAGPWIVLPQIVLAASGGCNNVALGGAGGGNAAIVNAACGNGGNGGAFSGLAASFNPVNFAPGTNIELKGTLTAFADRARSGAAQEAEGLNNKFQPDGAARRRNGAGFF